MSAQRFDTVLGLQQRRSPLAVIIKIAVYTLMVLVFAGPLIGLLIGAFSHVVDPTKFSLVPEGGFTFANFGRAGERRIWNYLFNSFVVVGFGLALQMLVSVFAAYSLARKRMRGASILMLLILATMMLPEEVIAVPLSVVLADVPPFGIVDPGMRVNLTNSYLGMILPVGAWGFSILVMTEFMKEVPIELEEAAKIDGAGDLRTFFFVILPLCRPALGVIGVFGFTMIWDQYLLPLIVAVDYTHWTLPLALRSLRGDEEVGIGVLLAGTILAVLPSILVFLAFQRQFVRGLTSGAIKG
ncbi:carbohydrate ABC transporter permease [Catelliglobosispora koreensis]|uniref:carbohydrate ABC transporter permease n=1 Tax=Catelliglobosispora koreensis TaxID=129052 RepID=UPI000372BDB5|nr:carbohydrate ABC transporter permease [Catelliglobosispora koreensis]